MIDPLLLTATQVLTFNGTVGLTNASAFFFTRDARLYLVTSRHVLLDDPSGHRPDRIVIELHTDASNLAMSTGFSIPLYRGTTPLWRQGTDRAGDVDIAVIPIDRAALPRTTTLHAFGSAHLVRPPDRVEVGTSLLVVGFPLGFHDSLHRMPVVRNSILASAFGLRFEGKGYFLTDGRMHRGTSGAPVVMRAPPEEAAALGALPWMLLGVHGARLDLGTRDQTLDEALGLNCSWYADILLTLTEN